MNSDTQTEGFFESFIDVVTVDSIECNPEAESEFEIQNLGIDLMATEPLIPYLYTVTSDAPLIRHAQYPIPVEYDKVFEPETPSGKISFFSVETLLFIFYVHCGDVLQLNAYNELVNRGYIWLAEQQIWKSPEGQFFLVDEWCFENPIPE